MIAQQMNGTSTMSYMSGLALGSPIRVETAPTPPRSDNSSLIREAQAGDCLAFEELVRQYDRAVLRLALHLTGSEDDAQDIYQEAFLKAYKNLASFRFECSFYTWIYRIVTNLCLDHLRRKQHRYKEVSSTVSHNGEQQDILDRVADAHPSSNPERDFMRRELGGQIAAALLTLTPRERMVFEMKHYHGMKLRMVASILHTTEGTTKNTLFRATQKLRMALAAARGSA